MVEDRAQDGEAFRPQTRRSRCRHRVSLDTGRAVAAITPRQIGTILAIPTGPMNKEILDALLTGMLESGDGVSDILLVVGKAPLVEMHGKLQDFPIDTG